MDKVKKPPGESGRRSTYRENFLSVLSQELSSTADADWPVLSEVDAIFALFQEQERVLFKTWSPNEVAAESVSGSDPETPPPILPRMHRAWHGACMASCFCRTGQVRMRENVSTEFWKGGMQLWPRVARKRLIRYDCIDDRSYAWQISLGNHNIAVSHRGAKKKKPKHRYN